MVAGLAIEAGALAARVRVNHPADRSAIGRRQFRSEEQAMFGERRVELILDDAGLDPDPARPTSMSRICSCGARRQRPGRRSSDWPFVPVPPPRGASLTDLKRGSEREPRDAYEVVGATREGDGLRRELINRVVSPQHGAVGVERRRSPSKPRARNSRGTPHRRRGFGGIRQTRDHGGPPATPEQSQGLSHLFAPAARRQASCSRRRAGTRRLPGGEP